MTMSGGTMMDKLLTPRQERYVSFVLSGLSETAAPRHAGFSKSYSRVAASRVGTLPAVKQAIERAQAELRNKHSMTSSSRGGNR